MKTVYVHAFLAGNLGDDLFVRILCRRYPGVHFRTIADRAYKDKFADLPNMQVFSPGDPEIGQMTEKLKKFRFLYGTDDFNTYLLKRSDAVIHIGGSVFVQHSEDWSEFYRMDKKLADNAKKLYVVGANFGPFTNPKYLEDYRKLFHGYKGICFRDHYSADLFPELRQVAYAPDVLFGLPVKPEKVKKKQAVFAPIEFGWREGKNGIAQYADTYLAYHTCVIRELIHRGYEIKLLSFCPAQGDDMMIERIRGALDAEENRKVSSLTYTGDPKPILKVFEESELCIGTRFHSLILGFLGKCKTLGIIYDHKTRNVLKDLKFERRLELSDLETQTPESVKAAVSELIAAKPLDVSSYIRGAGKQFQYTDQLLK